MGEAEKTKLKSKHSPGSYTTIYSHRQRLSNTERSKSKKSKKNNNKKQVMQ